MSLKIGTLATVFVGENIGADNLLWTYDHEIGLGRPKGVSDGFGWFLALRSPKLEDTIKDSKAAQEWMFVRLNSAYATTLHAGLFIRKNGASLN